MSKAQKVLNELSLDNSREKIIAAAIEAEDNHLIEAVPALTTLFHRTTDPGVRNAAAIALSVIGHPEAFHQILAYIRRPESKGTRGSLVYALSHYDCSSLVPELIDLAITDTWETCWSIVTIFNDLQAISPEEKTKGIIRIQDALKNNLEVNDKKDILEELIDVLSDTYTQ